MTELKSYDNTDTLMHYMANLIETKYPQLLNLSADFPSLEQAARESIKQTVADLTMLSTAVEAVKTEIELQNAPGDLFGAAMQISLIRTHTHTHTHSLSHMLYNNLNNTCSSPGLFVMVVP
jgi:hypothetical protein